MSKKERRTFTKEFKLDVIQQSYLRDNIRELANELGLRVELIYRWRSEYKSAPMESFPGKGVEALDPHERQLRALQTENAELRTERDILKKAIGIFGKPHG